MGKTKNNKTSFLRTFSSFFVPFDYASLFLLSYGKGSLKGGFDMVKELTGFEDVVKSTNNVISGEGKTDRQTV